MNDVYIESRFWWEPYFTAFEQRLPAALRYSYDYFDSAVALPFRISAG